MHSFILFNDEICQASEKVLAPGQVGLLSGWGVFSTLRVSRGVPFAFERHWERMKRDAAVLNVPFPSDPAPVRAGLARLFEANQAADATLRLVVVRNRGGIWEGPTDRPFDVIGLTTGLKDWGGGVKLAVQEQARHAASRFRGVKMLSWALNLVTLEVAKNRGFDEVVLLNERDEVAECTSANIFVARRGRVSTPPLSSGCLPGVTREVLLGEVKAAGIEIEEKALFVRDLEQADEVFITSTTRNLLPVVSIEGRALPSPGSVRDTLEAALERYIEAYVRTH